MGLDRQGDAAAREYERHRRSVTGMLSKRFPRFDDNERLEIYHEAWARVFAKQARGEEIQSLRAYLMQTAAAEAMNAVSRRRPPTPIGPDDPTLMALADESAAVEDHVVIRDQARIARELIGSLDPRQRDLFKLRWDLQLSAGEIRAALDLTQRQYQRLVEEGAEAIATRVQELEDGTWSRRKRSLLAACLVQVTVGDEVRDGIASEGQRVEAQRLLDSDPHVAALYTEVHGALRRAAAILPLPIPAVGQGHVPMWLSDRVAAIGDLLVDCLEAVRRESATFYLRASDATAFASTGAGTATVAVAGVVAVGGGAYYTVEQAAGPPAPAAAEKRIQPTETRVWPTRTAERAERAARRAARRGRAALPPAPQPSAAPAPHPAGTPEPSPTPAAPSPPPAAPAPTPTDTPTPTPAPSRPTSEFNFEN